MAGLAALTLAADPGPWRRAGFTVDEDDRCRLGTVSLLLRSPQDGGRGILSWTLSGVDAPAELDGLPTLTAPTDEGAAGEHDNGARQIDHLVVSTPDLDRTLGVLEGIGLERRRVRDSDTYGTPLRQVFYRLGEVILEVVGPTEPAGDGPARFFGIALTVDDLDAQPARFGDDIGRIKDAVQPGRRIATVRKTAGLGTRVALMSPGPQDG